MKQSETAVKFIGKEENFVERNYGSNLTFDAGQTRVLPTELAVKLLRHADVFEEGKPTKGDTKPVDKKPGKKDEDDEGMLASDKDASTAAQLADAQRIADEQHAEVNRRQDLVDQINLMDKQALAKYAKEKYGQVVPKNMSEANMRAKVTGYVDMYGMV